MNQRSAGRLAWTLLGLTIAAASTSWVFIYLSRSALVRDVIGFRGFDAVLAVVFATVGAVVASKRPSNPVGWLLLAFGAGNGPVALLQQYAFFGGIGRADPLWGSTVAAWTQEVLGLAQGAIFAFLLLLFPTGHLLSRRWGIVGALAVVASALEALAAAFIPGPIATFRTLDNPFGLVCGFGRLMELVGTA